MTIITQKKLSVQRKRWNTQQPSVERENAYWEQWSKERREEHNSHRKKVYRSKPERFMLYRAKDRAKRLGLPFNLTLKDLKVPEQCPALKVPLVIGDPDYAPSIDRLVPSKGYVRDNVVIVSVKANRMKNDATVNELKNLLEFYSTIL